MIALNKIATVSLLCLATATVLAATPPTLLNDPVDVSGDFRAFENFYYLADKVSEFDPASHTGKLVYQRAQFSVRHAFDNDLASDHSPASPTSFPKTNMPPIPSCRSPLILFPRAHCASDMTSGPQVHPPQEELMLAGAVPHDDSWKYEKISGGHRYTSAAGSVTILENPFHLELRDAERQIADGDRPHRRQQHLLHARSCRFALCAARRIIRAATTRRSRCRPARKFSAAANRSPASTSADRRSCCGPTTPTALKTKAMYKPMPFFMSSRGYGMFMHTTTPITCDFGHDFSGVNSLMIGDDELDLFVFLGTPKEILDEYTKLTGKSPLPPLWSFRPVDEPLHLQRGNTGARHRRASCAQNKIPCDVLHLDTGWFETDWQCDYEFSKTRFTDPEENAGRFEGRRLPRFLLATAVFCAEEQIVPRTRGAKSRRPRRARAICLTKTPCWIFPIRKPSNGIKANSPAC